MEKQPEDEIETLLTTYNELNSNIIEILHEEPSPLEFMRYVARNIPFIVKSAASNWKASQVWSAGYLRQALSDHEVNVAVTPFGNADSPTSLPGTSTLIFAKPHEESQPFPQFLDHIINQELSSSSISSSQQSEIRYAQTQDDNLPQEYALLSRDVPSSIPFARIALDKSPDATNLWIGNSKSVTALHRDNYENIYVQILGQKHFVLLPPVCMPGVNEQSLKGCTYHRSDSGSELILKEDIDQEGNPHNVPFAIWDPDRPDKNATPYSRLVRPMRVTLDPGDFLYLPAMWFHKVSQTADAEQGICVAVNYWYDMEFSGPLYCLDTLLRSVTGRRTKGSTS